MKIKLLKCHNNTNKVTHKVLNLYQNWNNELIIHFLKLLFQGILCYKLTNVEVGVVTNGLFK